MLWSVAFATVTMSCKAVSGTNVFLSDTPAYLLGTALDFLYEAMHEFMGLLVVVIGAIAVYNQMRPKPLPMEKETVLITGAGGGLGSAMALEFLKRNCRCIVLWDVNARALEETRERLLEKGASSNSRELTHIIAQTVDVASIDAICSAADDLRAMNVDVSVLVNNAAIFSKGAVTDLEDRNVVKAFEVNVFPFFRLVKQFVPQMMERDHGTILNISSGTAYLGVPNSSLYVSTKAALSIANECLLQELQMYKGIRTLLGEFGHIHTNMFKGFDPGYLGSIFMPSSDPDTIARLLVRKVCAGHEGKIVYPFLFRAGPLHTMWPLRIRNILLYLFNANHAFDRVASS